MEKLFVYGTLRGPEVQQRVIGRVVKGVHDRLSGFRKATVTINNETYPSLVQDRDTTESVDGFVLSLQLDEIRKTDAYETDAYRRRKVVLVSGTKAWVYV